MEKERLALEICREELLKLHRVSPALWVIFGLLFAGSTAVFVGMIAWIVSENEVLAFVHWFAIGLLIVCWFPSLALIGLLVVEALKQRNYRKLILAGELEIVEDTLKRAYEDHEIRGYGRNRRVKWCWVFVFESYGTYRMSDRWNYRWSDRYAMGSHKVWETAREGDRFYILRMRDDLTRLPLQVYNQKYFWYSADGSMTPPRTGSSWRDSVNLE